jgi:site-specific recombinase XerD
VVKRRAELAGMDASEVSGHSLRAGMATAAANAGVQERVIAQTIGHKSMTVLRRHIREGNLFNENAASAVGL